MTEGKTGAELRNLVHQAVDRAFVRSIQQGCTATAVITMADFM
jgi:hypothetical protein